LPHGILLVEEYGALAVAIASALRAFAPLQVVEVAHNFAEAQILAAKMRPELFVLDLDPPPFGVVAFFNRLRRDYPEARALVIATGTSRELCAERGTAAALQFIEKPFDLAEFGAAVQALAGPWSGHASGGRGTMRDLNLLDIAQVQCLGLGSTIVRLETSAGAAGEIHFQNGQITHAATTTAGGIPALAEMANWYDFEAGEKPLPEEAPRTIDAVWPALLIPLARQVAQQSRLRSLGTEATQRRPSARTGKKILVVDDTEMLLVFVADVLETANRNFQILTASTGAEGLRLAASERPDLVLLDYSLADITGDKICQALLDDKRTAQIPVLMMSGHLTELARTAGAYSNVVAALPKPFLSGALINAIEKALADGPRTKPTLSSSAPKPSPAAPETIAVPANGSPTLFPNGHGPGGNGSPAKQASEPVAAAAVPEAATFVVTPEPLPPPFSSPLPTAPAASPTTTSPTLSPAPSKGEPTIQLVRQPNLMATFSFDVVTLQFTPYLQTAAARLEPINRFVQLRTENRAPFETGFRIAVIEPTTEGGIKSLRLVPTREPIPLPAAANSFAIGKISLEPTTHHLELKAARERSMRVQLTAAFTLVAVELSPQFEVASLLLRASGREVLLRNRGEDPGANFELTEVEVDSAGELRALLVRPTAS
jgi:DNA-binding response OmpR family regulator